MGSTYSPASSEPDIIYLRYQVFDPSSDVADEAQAIYDPFEITMNWECSEDTVAIDQSLDLGYMEYIIDVDEATAHVVPVASSVLHSITACSISAEFFYWDEDIKDWLDLPSSTYNSDPFASMSTADGSFTLATKDGAGHSLRPYTRFSVRVEYTANDVKLWYTERMVADEFDIVFKEDCSDNTITLGAPLPDIEYYIGQTTNTATDTEFTVNYSVGVSSDACPITAKLYVLDPSTEDWVEYNSASPIAYHAPVVQSSW